MWIIRSGTTARFVRQPRVRIARRIEIRRRRWTVAAGHAETPFGKCLIAESPRGICHLAFVDSIDGRAEWDKLQQHWPYAHVQRSDMTARGLAEQIFAPRRVSSPYPTLRALVKGTKFQVQVWQALLHIKPGTLASYGHVAQLLNRPSAARVVGSAVSQNPLAYLIPCHRVIRQTGVIGDYRWGPVRKRAMLAWESTALFVGASQDHERDSR
jgi:AraC family transcriptional regulator of adaptative response/methylated-DNA-[protein]-cysteine methyltransferase